MANWRNKRRQRVSMVVLLAVSWLASTVAIPTAAEAQNVQAGIEIDVPPLDDGVRPTGVLLTLFTSDENGDRGDLIGEQDELRDAGTIRLSVESGCFIVLLRSIGQYVWFRTNSAEREFSVCVESGATASLQAGARIPIDGTPDRTRGTVTTVAGEPVPGVFIDLFRPTDGISNDELRQLSIADHQARDYRAEYLSSQVSDDSGSYLFYMPDFTPNCYVTTMIAPDGYQFSTGKYLRRTTCPNESVELTVERDGSPQQSAIEGTVLADDGKVAPGVIVDLFTATGDGSRGSFLDDVTADDTGKYTIAVDAGCYIIVQIAPADFDFASSRTPYNEKPVCVDSGERETINGVLVKRR